MLVEAYEQLRGSVTGANGSGNLRGLAILMREGMAAWMHTVAGLPAVPRPEAAVGRAAAALALVPTGVQREVIEVLATMALTSELEVRA